LKNIQSKNKSENIEGRFVNKELAKRTTELQSEFDTLLQEMMENRQLRNGSGIVLI
jgi:hypothetical protein